MILATNGGEKPQFLSQAAANTIDNAGISPISVQAVHQASKFQEEMVLVTMMDQHHRVCMEAQHFISRETIHAAGVNRAAHALARRHAVLRSIFCWNENITDRHPSRISLVVLGTNYPQQKITLVEKLSPGPDLENTYIEFCVLGLPGPAAVAQWHGGMPWKISINQLPNRGSRVTLCYHHALLDEVSARQLLLSLQDEMKNPGSVEATSDVYAVHRGQSYRRSRDMRTRLQDKISGIPFLPFTLGDSDPANRDGHGETIGRVAVESHGRSSLPPWMARLALCMALRAFAKVEDAVFLELTSGRGVLPSIHREALGPVLVPQLRWAKLKSHTPLSDIAEKLHVENEIHHAFSPGEIESFFPQLDRSLQACLVCHTESCASGVGSWAWDCKESRYDKSLVIEILPHENASLVRVCYHRNRFTDQEITAFQQFICGCLQWLQENQDNLKVFTLESAVSHILSARPGVAVCIDHGVPFEQPDIHPGLPTNASESTPEQLSWRSTHSCMNQIEDQQNICAHHLFEQAARRMPHKIALQYECSEYMTYEQLNDRCNAVSDALTVWLDCSDARVFDQEIIVPISFDKGFDLVIAMLAVLKSGAAYVPIDTSHPADRIANIISRTGASVIISDGHTGTDKLHEVSEKTGTAIVTLDELTQTNGCRAPCIRPGQEQSASSLAYIQVTSGTTGTPKCIMIEHRNLLAFMQADEPDFLGNWRTSKLQLSNRTFDIAMADIFGTLGRGGRLVLGPDAKILSCLPEWLEMTSVTDLNTTPLVADLLEDHVPAHLSVLMVGGEPFHPSLINHTPKKCRLYNNYGPSETTFVATSYRISPEDEGRATIPIGRPFGICKIYILAPDSMECAPAGEVGEICIGGPQVSRGYLRQPDLTDTKFVHNPFENDGHQTLYRTGDLGRYSPDGRLDYLGRIDRQVKIRGQRVETLEIETAIGKHPRVKACAVVIGESLHGKALVAFVEINPGRSLADELTNENHDWLCIKAEIKSNMAGCLPDYMVPGHIAMLEDGLPRLASNKLDQQALASRATLVLSKEEFQATAEYVPPQDEVERHVCEAFSDVLSCGAGITNSFLDLGGHSVTAIRVASRIRKELSTNITFRDVLECLTPRSLSIRIRESGELLPHSAASYHVPDSKPVEQSFAQGRLWFLEQLHSNLSWYHLPLAFRLRGPLHLDSLEAALLAIEQRHETLRTTFEDRDDVTIQVVHPFVPRKIRLIDIGQHPGDREEHLRSVLRREQTTPFDLKTEPGWRSAALRVDAEDHVVSLVLHHIIADGWSLGVLVRELISFYSAKFHGKDPLAQLPSLPIQYRDYSLWQHQEKQLIEQERQLQYWTDQLRGSHPAEFLCDRPRPPVPSGQANVKGISITGALYRHLQRFCQRFHITPFIVLLAAFRAAHYRMTGSVDATIGTPITNRNREEHEGLIGLFVNMQCMRIQVLDEDTFELLVQRVKDTATAAFAHNEVPFEKIVSALHPAREGSRNPLIQTIFAVHPERVDKVSIEGLESEYINLTNATRFDLEFHFYQDDEGLDGEVMFATDLFHHRTIETLLAIFQDILEGGLERPGTEVEAMSLLSGLSALHHMNLVKVHRTDYPRNSSIVDVFREQVAAHPEVMAVKDASHQWSYDRLDQESEKMANWLSKLGLPTEAVIAVFAKRSCETIAAFLGILKANMAYLPLDIKFPAARIEIILSAIEGRRAVLVGSDVQLPMIEVDGLEVVPMVDPFGLDNRVSNENNERSNPGPSSLAYVMFTSGSTGQPKGVMIEHRAVVSRVRDCNMLDNESAAKPFAHISSIAFDAAVWEIYASLLNGGTVVCIDTMTVLDFVALSNVFSLHGIRIALMTPALLKQFLSESPASISELHTLVVGGERSDPQDLSRARKLVQKEIINAYGPTENTVFSTFYRLPDGGQYHNGVPIGEAATNSGAYVMDQHLRLVPPGVMGELVVVGDGLSRGYTDAKRNVNRFVDIELDGQIIRAYRTGDRVRHRPMDGQLEYIGRMDGQVKIRGFRVETGEIEHAILESGLAENAAVLLQQPDDQEARLVAFVKEAKDLRNQGRIDRGEQEFEEAWQRIFSETTYDSKIDTHKAGRDFSGWKSMYDGSYIDTGEMNEWLDDTIAAMLNGAPPGHVVEVGTGSGMILFNLAEGLQSYVGLEPVKSIVEFVHETIDKLNPTLAEKVTLHVGTATDLDKIAVTDVSPDLVVVNSVAQYFPSAEYLGRLIEDLLRVHQAKTIFFGDMRSYALYTQFQVTKALHAGDTITPEYIHKIMTETAESETELLVDPAFFTALTDQFPDLIRHVEILPKRMQATNELSCYRYSAVIHAARQDYLHEVHTVDDDQWIDYSASKLSRQGLLELLQQTHESATVAIANIPHSKTIVERLIVEALSSQSSVRDAGWISSLRSISSMVNALSAVDLQDLASRAGFRVELSWARQFSQHGGLDAIFHRIRPESGRQRTVFRFCTDHAGRSTQTLSNNPMQSQSGRNLEKELQQRLKERLPSYMVPAVIRLLDEMPINHSGKVDRRALSEMAATTSLAQIPTTATHVPPRDEVERVVCDEFANVLGSDVGITDNFFDLGGHSLMATRAVSRIAERMKCAVTVRDLFDYPVPKALANRISKMCDSRSQEEAEAVNILTFANLAPIRVDEWHQAVEAIGICTEDVVQLMPCTAFQEGVLTTDLVLGETPAYLATMRLEFDELLDIDKLQSAWRSTVKREEVLRTVFMPSTQGLSGQGTCSGAFLQAVLRCESAEVDRVTTPRLAHPQENHSPLDLGMGHIPVSLTLTRNEISGNCVIELTIHHALYDEAYLSYVLDGLSRDYHLAQKPKPDAGQTEGHVPFTAFIRMLQDKDRAVASSFWREYLNGAPAGSWPIPYGLKGPMNEDRVPLAKSAEWKGNAADISRVLGTTPAGIARAAFALCIAAHGDADDVVFGEVSSGRSHSGFVTGPCITTHPVRIRLGTDVRQQDNDVPKQRVSIETLLKRTRDAYLDTIPHQHLGVESIRQLTGNPDLLPFQVLFVYQETHSKGTDQLPWASFRVGHDELRHSDFPLVLEVSCQDPTGHLRMRCVFDPFILPPADVEWFLQHFVDSLNLIAHSSNSQDDWDCTEAKLTITEHENRAIQLLSTQREDPHEAECEEIPTVVNIIRRQAMHAPDKIALQVQSTEFVTYRQLDDLSSRIARGLHEALESQARGIIEQQYVPIFFEKSVHMVATILGILKAGAAFVPMDIQHPIPRLKAICEATQARVIFWDGITGGDKLRNLSRSTGATLCTVNALLHNNGPSFNERAPSLESLAYVLFTSGSTGTPKGVMVDHRNLASFVASNEGSTDCSWTSNRLALLAHTFDASMGDLFATLCKGGRLHFVRQDDMLPRLSHWLEALSITHLSLTPTLGALIVNELSSDQGLPFLRCLVFGGEPFRLSFLSRVPRAVTIWNGYGPTEAAIEVAACKLQGPDTDVCIGRSFAPIGTPGWHRQIRLLHPGTNERVPIGCIGELCISGPQVARGYLGQPDLTAAQFTPDPFSVSGRERMYRTGDMAKLHGDGYLEYLGRIDGQVKLRGLRIDTAEICSVAQNHPHIMTCAVVKLQRNGAEVLAALVEANHGTAISKLISENAIKEYIARSVPVYMVPAHIWVQTTPLPRTTSGKLDRRAIAEIAESKYKEYMESPSGQLDLPVRAAAGTLEAKIASLWAKVLGIKEDTIDMTAEFYQMGGDSVRAIVLLALLRREGLHFDMTDLSQTSTIQSQAVKARQGKPESSIPGHVHLRMRQESVATIVLVHPFLAHSTVFEPLLPLLDDAFDILLLDDPFLGTAYCPETLSEWANHYLNDIQAHVQTDQPVVFGGYSFGGLVAFEMAHLWDKLHGENRSSVILIDPGTFGRENIPAKDRSQRDDLIKNSLGMTDVKPGDMLPFQEHFDRHLKALRQLSEPPIYDGQCLHLALPDRLQDGVVPWWRARCSDITLCVLDCRDHYKIMKDAKLVEAVGRLINEHCHAYLTRTCTMSSASSESGFCGGSSRTDVSTEDGDAVGRKNGVDAGDRPEEQPTKRD
ncbi:non-ribosomal peptide synthetase [Aspergillus ibericus CBS 121593]|uniref:Non-ribosomal peptide synthetase n=1 Tax=Aspergillus ibericus CBS 121593 TaxID=1448316 RepID=A0A395GHM4_9EURO|nr:non-ribosomal peptide synthetase [Aspergillus ibericus CBS 121593]RAK94915.1 non-ribosomal peptide synthetase [Aspergillus ibericus CBS 121593]